MNENFSVLDAGVADNSQRITELMSLIQPPVIESELVLPPGTTKASLIISTSSIDDLDEIWLNTRGDNFNFYFERARVGVEPETEHEKIFVTDYEYHRFPVVLRPGVTQFVYRVDVTRPLDGPEEILVTASSVSGAKQKVLVTIPNVDLAFRAGTYIAESIPVYQEGLWRYACSGPEFNSMEELPEIRLHTSLSSEGMSISPCLIYPSHDWTSDSFWFDESDLEASVVEDPDFLLSYSHSGLESYWRRRIEQVSDEQIIITVDMKCIRNGVEEPIYTESITANRE